MTTELRNRKPNKEKGKNENRRSSRNKPLIEEKKLWHLRLFWLVSGALILIKSLLFRCYTSTDFEVHRNWMAITANLPLRAWYYNNVSQWTLDYPPFFAYFERGLAFVAESVDSSMLTIQSKPLMNDSVLIFQRLSVLVFDLVYVSYL